MSLLKLRDPISLFKLESLECKGVTGSSWYGQFVRTIHSSKGTVSLRLGAGWELMMTQLGLLSSTFLRLPGTSLNF